MPAVTTTPASILPFTTETAELLGLDDADMWGDAGIGSTVLSYTFEPDPTDDLTF